MIIKIKPIGGDGQTVEIDESKFGKHKYNKGHPVEGQWAFRQIERESEYFYGICYASRSRYPYSNHQRLDKAWYSIRFLENLSLLGK